jgi:hypothetical protein
MGRPPPAVKSEPCRPDPAGGWLLGVSKEPKGFSVAAVWGWVGARSTRGGRPKGEEKRIIRGSLDGMLIKYQTMPMVTGFRRQRNQFMPANTQALIEKIQALPAERISEVEDFVDFIRLREQERALTRAAAATSAPAFAAIWNNPDDDAYDAL